MFTWKRCLLGLFGPDEGGSAGSTGQNSAVASPPTGGGGAASAPAPTPTAATGGGAPSGLQGGTSGSPAPTQTPAPAAGATPPTQPAFIPIHEALRNIGYQLPAGVEGHAALQHLVAAAQRAGGLEELARYGQQFMPHAEKFQAWMREQQLAAEQAKAKSWFKAPEFDPSWRGKITRDANGNLVAVPGADPTLPQKYLAYLEHQQQFLDKFSTSPIDAIKPGLEEVVRQIASELIQQNLGGYQEQVSARQFVEQNKSWLYTQDQMGRQVLSPWGHKFRGYVEQASQLGIHTDSGRVDYAMAKLENEFNRTRAEQTLGQQGAQQTGEQQKQQFLQQAAGAGATHIPPAGGSIPGNGTTPAPAQNTSLPLDQRLRQKFQLAGVTDEQVNSTLNGRR